MTSKNNDFKGKKIGDEYDLWGPVVPHHDRFQQTVADATRKYCLDVKKRGIVKVLEIGYGTGITTEVILKTNPRIKITGIDVAKNMYEQAEKRLRGYGNKNSRLTLLLQDAVTFTQYMCGENEFDIVASAYTIHNLPNQEKLKLFRNIYGALKPNGILIEADVISHNDMKKHERELAIRLGNLDHFDKIGRPDMKKEWTEHHYYDDQLGIRMTERELTQMLTEAGFKDIQKTYREHLEATFVARK